LPSESVTLEKRDAPGIAGFVSETVGMSDHTRIEWTDATWNPFRGCTKISPGCAHCYAETFAERFRGVPGHPYEQGFDLRLVPEKLADPLKWTKPRMVFVNSMSDLFHDEVPEDYINEVVGVMQKADWHTYQVLTKRSGRMRKMLENSLCHAAAAPQIWWGVSVENRRDGLPRVDDLRESPAVTRFLSVEPLLEDLGRIDLTGIHWVIVGGESGPGFRPIDSAWITGIRDQCRSSGVSFFFKQWGGVHKTKAGRSLDGQTYDEIPDRGSRAVLDPERRKTLLAEQTARRWQRRSVPEPPSG
jgi:protein gp37